MSQGFWYEALNLSADNALERLLVVLVIVGRVVGLVFVVEVRCKRAERLKVLESLLQFLLLGLRFLHRFRRSTALKNELELLK